MGVVRFPWASRCALSRSERSLSCPWPRRPSSVRILDVIHLEARVEEGELRPQRARAYMGVGMRPIALSVVTSSFSRHGRARLLTLRHPRGPCRGEQKRPHRERGCLRGSGYVPWHRLSLPRPSRGLEGSGHRHLVHLEAHIKEGGRRPTKSEGVCGGRDASHGAGRRRLVHLKAQKGAAVVASSILRPSPKRTDTTPRRARASTGVRTHPMAPAVVASSISRPRRARSLSLRPS